MEIVIVFCERTFKTVIQVLFILLCYSAFVDEIFKFDFFLFCPLTRHALLDELLLSSCLCPE